MEFIGLFFIFGGIMGFLYFLVLEVRLSRIQRHTKRQAVLADEILTIQGRQLDTLKAIHTTLSSRLEIPAQLKRQ